MNNENIYEQIQKAIAQLPENFSVLEEQIDIQLQMEYFNYDRNIKRKLSNNEILIYDNDLSAIEITIDKKKEILVLLASQDKVEAYRAIEKFSKNAAPEIKAWSILALQESRMLIQSSLLNEHQVFISTGLGGKYNKLRYFVALVGRDSVIEFSEVQQKILQNEIDFALNKNEGEIEELTIKGKIAISVLLLPVKADIQSFFFGLINEINQYGDFITEDIIITNVKKMTFDEIILFLNSK